MVLKFPLCVLALMCIVKPDGPPMLCKTDEIGEIVLNSRASGTMYYGLPGVTKNTFEVRSLNLKYTFLKTFQSIYHVPNLSVLFCVFSR